MIPRTFPRNVATFFRDGVPWAGRGHSNRSGQAPSIGTDRGNEAPGATCRTSPGHATAIGAEVYTGKGICFPQTPHLAQAKVPDQSFSPHAPRLTLLLSLPVAYSLRGHE